MSHIGSYERCKLLLLLLLLIMVFAEFVNIFKGNNKFQAWKVNAVRDTKITQAVPDRHFCKKIYWKAKNWEV